MMAVLDILIYLLNIFYYLMLIISYGLLILACTLLLDFVNLSKGKKPKVTLFRFIISILIVVLSLNWILNIGNTRTDRLYTKLAYALSDGFQELFMDKKDNIRTSDIVGVWKAEFPKKNPWYTNTITFNKDKTCLLVARNIETGYTKTTKGEYFVFFPSNILVTKPNWFPEIKFTIKSVSKNRLVYEAYNSKSNKTNEYIYYRVKDKK